MRISDWSSDVCSSDLFLIVINLFFQCMQRPVGSRISYVHKEWFSGGPGKMFIQVLHTGIADGVGQVKARWRFISGIIAINGGCKIIGAPRTNHELTIESTRSEERRGGKTWVGTCRS